MATLRMSKQNTRMQFDLPCHQPAVDILLFLLLLLIDASNAIFCTFFDFLCFLIFCEVLFEANRTLIVHCP